MPKNPIEQQVCVLETCSHEDIEETNKLNRYAKVRLTQIQQRRTDIQEHLPRAFTNIKGLY